MEKYLNVLSKIVEINHTIIVNSKCGYHLNRIMDKNKIEEIRPGQKLGNLRNLINLGNFFPRFLNPSFRFYPTAKIENSEKRKLGIIFLRFLRFPKFPSFQFAIFSFIKKIFFNILK